MGIISTTEERNGYELNGYADYTDKADERGFKKLRYTIINDKLKSAFVRLVRVVRVSIDSLLFRIASFLLLFSQLLPLRMP